MPDTTGTGIFQVKAIDRQGNGAQVQMFGGGAATAGHAAVFDSDGNVVDGGSTGGGTAATTHGEPLTDGAGNFIVAGGDVIEVLGVAN
jgi:hypothetical protein